ncbi:MAG: LysR family transcriptional regulator [Erysipelotrichaceae bacterium]|nr:LysR family transcriptional regulator [Erysipelotrichaceae bacterium]
MNTKYFESIIELARTKNFNRAAENLYITQPALTYQINSVEDEVGFRIFDRSGKGATLTPAGEQFITTIRDINTQLNRAIEQGQNFSVRYRDNIRIGMSVRSAIYHLPEIINLFHEEEPSVSITPIFDYHDHLEPFLKGETDILFAFKDSVKHLPDIRIHDFYKSHIYFVCRQDDPLSKKKIITKDDLSGRTLMIGGGSPGPLKKLQQEIIEDKSVSYFNSNDHDTSLTFVATGEAIVLSPGILNDRNPQYSWIPFDTDVTFDCVLCTHAEDNRKTVKYFIDLLKEYYSDKDLEL